MPGAEGTQISRPKLPLSPHWGEEASLSDYCAVWPVLPQQPGPHAEGYARGKGPLIQACKIRGGFLEEVTAKPRPEAWFKPWPLTWSSGAANFLSSSSLAFHVCHSAFCPLLVSSDPMPASPHLKPLLFLNIVYSVPGTELEALQSL